jgi:hypothetical protein
MSVAIRVVAFAKDAPILIIRKCRIVIEVRGGEFDFAR